MVHRPLPRSETAAAMCARCLHMAGPSRPTASPVPCFGPTARYPHAAAARLWTGCGQVPGADCASCQGQALSTIGLGCRLEAVQAAELEALRSSKLCCRRCIQLGRRHCAWPLTAASVGCKALPRQRCPSGCSVPTLSGARQGSPSPDPLYRQGFPASLYNTARAWSSTHVLGHSR